MKKHSKTPFTHVHAHISKISSSINLSGHGGLLLVGLRDGQAGQKERARVYVRSWERGKGRRREKIKNNRIGGIFYFSILFFILLSSSFLPSFSSSPSALLPTHLFTYTLALALSFCPAFIMQSDNPTSNKTTIPGKIDPDAD